jgi:hypothetical protein
MLQIFHQPGHVKTVEPGHLHVHDHHPGTGIPDFVDGGKAVIRRRHIDPLPRQEINDFSALQSVVVNHQDLAISGGFIPGLGPIVRWNIHHHPSLGLPAIERGASSQTRYQITNPGLRLP